jgi:acyl carrier protein
VGTVSRLVSEIREIESDRREIEERPKSDQLGEWPSSRNQAGIQAGIRRGRHRVSDSLVDRIRGLVCEQLGVDPSALKPDANILEDLGADSLDVVELVMAIEEAFDIEITDEDAEAIRTLGDVEKYVSDRVAA